MESEEGGRVIHACEQHVSRGNSLDTRHIRKQLGIHEVETRGQQRE